MSLRVSVRAARRLGRRSVGLVAAAGTLAAAAVVVVAHSSSAQAGPGALTGLDVSSGNRRAPITGLYDWSHAGYRGGGDLPGDGQINPSAACQVTAAELASQYNVRPDDNADD